jgi:MoxR-like ATPase
MKNAKIQITVKVDDLPKEVNNRLYSMSNLVKITNDTLEKGISDVREDNILNAAEKLQKVRDELSYIDTVIADCHSILVAYAKFKTQNLEPKIPIQEQVQEEETKQ